MHHICSLHASEYSVMWPLCPSRSISRRVPTSIFSLPGHFARKSSVLFLSAVLLCASCCSDAGRCVPTVGQKSSAYVSRANERFQLGKACLDLQVLNCVGHMQSHLQVARSNEASEIVYFVGKEHVIFWFGITPPDLLQQVYFRRVQFSVPVQRENDDINQVGQACLPLNGWRCHMHATLIRPRCILE